MNAPDSYLDEFIKLLNLAISNFYPNLVVMKLKTLKIIFNNCQQLETTGNHNEYYPLVH